MSLTCVMLAALLCGPVEYREAIYEHSKDGPRPPVVGIADIAPLGVQINVFWPGRPGFASRSALDRACDGETCLYYRKSCNGNRRVCDYSVGIDISSSKSLIFEIQYRSLKELREAERRIFLVPSPGSPARIAISQMNHESQSWTFVDCPTGLRAESTHMQGCD